MENININLTALFVAIAVFVVAALVAWILKRYSITDSAGFIVLVVLPIATYGIVSGYVSKITLPGGWAAEFREVAAAIIEPTALVEEVQGLEIIDKTGIDAIQNYLAEIDVGKPVAISLVLGRKNYYSDRAIITYIQAFQTFDPNLTVLFVEENTRKFVASTHGTSVLAALQLDFQSGNQRFLGALEDADLLRLSV